MASLATIFLQALGYGEKFGGPCSLIRWWNCSRVTTSNNCLLCTSLMTIAVTLITPVGCCTDRARGRTQSCSPSQGRRKATPACESSLVVEPHRSSKHHFAPFCWCSSSGQRLGVFMEITVDFRISPPRDDWYGRCSFSLSSQQRGKSM